jgi:hypothetical protein
MMSISLLAVGEGNADASCGRELELTRDDSGLSGSLCRSRSIRTVTGTLTEPDQWPGQT